MSLAHESSHAAPPTPDDEEDMSTIPRDKLVTMVDQVNEMHEGWSRAQVEIIRLGRSRSVG